MLGSQARHQPYYEAFTSCSEWVVPVDANSMPLEACCQEDRGINAVIIDKIEKLRKAKIF
jgi:hypothetical protein